MTAAIAITSETKVAETAIALLAENGYNLNEYNPHRVAAWLIRAEGAEFIAIGSCEQFALNACVNENLWDHFLAESFDDYEESADESDLYNLGNASELFWIERLMISHIITA
ncbi:MAG: hypothetical protein ACRC47_16145 [Shewanella sp.]